MHFQLIFQICLSTKTKSNQAHCSNNNCCYSFLGQHVLSQSKLTHSTSSKNHQTQFSTSQKNWAQKKNIRLKEITSIHRQTLPLNQISPIRIRIWAWKESLKKCTQSDITSAPRTLVASTWHQTNVTNYTTPISQFFKRWNLSTSCFFALISGHLNHFIRHERQINIICYSFVYLTYLYSLRIFTNVTFLLCLLAPTRHTSCRKPDFLFFFYRNINLSICKIKWEYQNS